ncbi:hypothetical protein ACFY8W_02515 [Streptomyces sp. NPDC012637]|uniref:hypothetical protein n=1 Tax=Streptomyces sp. NPDC012637 TaxID=3364842 RepID=UPI0036EE6001
MLGALLLSELAVFAVVVAAGLGIFVLRGAPDVLEYGGDWDHVLDVLLIFFLPVGLGFYLVQGVVSSLASALAEHVARGMRVSVIGLLGASTPKVPGAVGGYLLTVFLFPLLVTPLAPLLARPWVLFTLAPSIMAHDGVGMLQALRRASHLVKGVWWPVFTTLAVAAMVTFGADVAVGFIPFDSMVNGFGDGDESIGVTDASLFYGLIIGAITVFISALMFQIAFLHLVGDQICAGLRRRRAVLTQPQGHG